MLIFIVIALIIFGYQFYLGFVGIEYHFGTLAALAALALAFMLRITFPITIGSFFGATDVMGWPWYIGVLIAIPGLLLIIPGMVAAAISAGLSKFHSSFPGVSSTKPQIRSGPWSENRKSDEGEVNHKKGLLIALALFSVAIIAFFLADEQRNQPRSHTSPLHAPQRPQTAPPYSSSPPTQNTPAPRIPEYSPTFDRLVQREEVFGNWVLQVQRDPNGELGCVLLYGGTRAEFLRSNGLRTGIGWTHRSGERLFYDSFTIGQVPLNITIDSQSFVSTYTTTYVLSDQRRRHYYRIPTMMLRPFMDGGTMTIEGAQYSLRGSSNAYNAFQDCRKL